jgi:two-component system chemotaxis response regulator CheY
MSTKYNEVEVTLLKTLIVEDEPVSRQVLERMMSRYGATDVAVNGQEAIDRFVLAH